jgi:hypothetical protein
MRFLLVLVGFLVLPLCLTVSAWSQLSYTVPVVDQSEPGSPLKISGTTVIHGASYRKFSNVEE